MSYLKSVVLCCKMLMTLYVHGGCVWYVYPIGYVLGKGPIHKRDLGFDSGSLN